MAKLSDVYVPGEGPVPCALMVLGEAPGADETDQRRPFVGKSGKLLRWALSQALPDKEYYIDNIIQYRPENNATPTTLQIREAIADLESRLCTVRPTIIIAVGATALSVFDSTRKITDVTGRPFKATLGQWSGVVLPCIHPAYVLRNRNLMPVFGSSLENTFASVVEQTFDYRHVTGNELRTYLVDTLAFSLDFETTEPMWAGKFCPRLGVPTGFSVSCREGTARYTTDSIECIRDLLENETIRKVCHNASFDLGVCNRTGIFPRNIDDTMVMAFVLRRVHVGLKDLSRSEFGIEQPRWESVANLAPDDPQFAQYAAMDADMTFRLDRRFLHELDVEGLRELYDKVERDVPATLAQVHENGIPVNRDRLEDFHDTLVAERDTLYDTLHTTYPHVENWNSPVMRRRLLYGPKQWSVQPGSIKLGRLKHGPTCKGHKLEECEYHMDIRTGAQQALDYLPPGLALPPQYVEGSDLPSTSMASLRALRREGHEQPLLVDLEYWASVQQASRQTINILSFIQPDGRLHPSYIQAGAFDEFDAEGADASETGRLSARNPNVMALMHHGDTERPYVAVWAKSFRQCFVAPPGWKWVKVDVNKEEPIIGGLVSGDQVWLDDVTGGGDVYKVAAGYAFGKPPEEINVEERQIGKRMAMAWLNRARAYGIRKSAFWLSKKEAQDWCESMDERYQGITQWHQTVVIPYMYKRGYVNTMFGRRCKLMAPNSHRPFNLYHRTKEQREAERECVPMIVQGTAADLLKLALQRVDAQLELDWAMIISLVHDELNLLVREDMVDHVCRNVLDPMLDGFLSPLLGVEITVGDNWADLKEWTA